MSERIKEMPRLRRMSRKRFTKLVMGHGVSRKGASCLAKIVQSAQRQGELQNSISKLYGQSERMESVSYAKVAYKMCLVRR